MRVIAGGHSAQLIGHERAQRRRRPGRQVPEVSRYSLGTNYQPEQADCGDRRRERRDNQPEGRPRRGQANRLDRLLA